jgi:hypothetical protein
MVNQKLLSLFFIIIVLFTPSAAACYNEKDLPPCPPNAKWPDPCAGIQHDAGRD